MIDGASGFAPGYSQHLASDSGREVSTAAFVCYLDYNGAKTVLALNHFNTRDTILSPQSSQTLKQSLPGETFGTVLNILAEKYLLTITAFLMGTVGSINTKLSVFHHLTRLNPSWSPGDAEKVCSV